MKICNNCQKEIPEDHLTCPHCGEVSVCETTVEAKPKKTGLIIGAIIAAIAVIALVVVLLLPKAGTPSGDSAGTGESHHINAYGYPSYSIHYAVADDGAVSYSYLNEAGETVTLTDSEVSALMDQEVARSGEHILTNRTLIYYYEQQFYTFYNSYGSYISYLLDTSKSLDEQIHYSGSTTWQQYVLDASIQYFLQAAALYDEALAAGHTLSEAEQASLDDLETDLTYFAQQYGYETAEDYLQAFYGPYADLDSYHEFLTICTMADSYAYVKAQAVEITDEAISNYYDENAEEIQSNYGIQKVDKNTISVRHILITPASTTNEAGESEITDEAWAEAEAEAQRIYDLWLNGEATEDAFAALATEYTTDPGSQTTGGLYENVYPGQMITEFNDWCFADGRRTGDHGIVKTPYGYHIMYFVAEGDEIFWKTAVKDMLLSETLDQLWLNAGSDRETTQDMSRAILLSAILPSSPADAESEELETATK